jgi:transposase-like protein
MGQRYGAIVRLWENAWTEFIPFLDYDLEIRTVICSRPPRIRFALHECEARCAGGLVAAVV